MIAHKTLNIGCGKTRLPDSIGMDRVMLDGFVDVVHDLNLIPYPFKDNSFADVHMYHVLEHLDDPLLVIEELHRIIEPDGTLHIKVPHFSSNGAFTDITHKRPFSYFSFDPFVPNNYQNFYTDVRFDVEHRRIKYLGLYPNDGIYAKYIHPNRCPWLLRPFVRLLDGLINVKPFAFERLWCYLVGGACEVEFRLRKLP